MSMVPEYLEYTSAVHIQRVVRGFLGRLAALRQANLVYEKIFDPKTHAYYYYNTHSFETTWQPPTVVTRILGEFGDLETIAPTYTEEEAAVMIQAAWRCWRGKSLARALLASVVSKVFDESIGAYYYFNSLTGETSWYKPALFGAEDVENYSAGTLTAEGGGADPFGTGSYGYDQSQGWVGYEAWTTEQEQQQDENGNGYEGWLWDDASGWYYDEELAAKLLADGRDGISKSDSADGNGTPSGDGESDSDSSRGEGGGAGGDASGDDDEAAERKRQQRRKRKRRSLAPRTFPRSKAQRLVDDMEDSVDGARPESLDLSKLDMDRVTSRVYRFDWLQHLDLSNNRLYRISPDLAGMENLVELNLRHNRIQTIPDDLEALTKLKHLRLGHNRIGGFRGNIYLISSLETLDLGHNRLKEVPLQVGDLQLLKRTREWKIGLGLLRELVTLDVSYNRLNKWPPQVEDCRTLHDLRLEYNKLQEVPDVVGRNTALTSLNISGNSLTDLPDTINSLSALTRLDVSNNKLKAHSIRPLGRKERGPRLASLAVLRLDGNRLTEGPVAVETFQTLTELDVSDNPISGWMLDVSGLLKMKHLRLRGVGLDQCPKGIGQLSKLETLDLSENRLDALDQSTAALFKLKTLGLRGNNISDLRSCVGSMVSLTSLDAGGNNLVRIPPELARCMALETLDVNGGTIDFLPEGLSKLTNLRVLRAQDNRLMTIPSEFQTLTALEELRLGGNQLSSLPASLRTLKKMRYAELSRNVMESPPPVTRQWPLLTHLVLSRNPLRGRRHQSLRLLQAAQQGHDAMHRGEWEKAARFLNEAAEAYVGVVYTVPDFPDPGGEGLPLAKTRPHDMVAFHHVNLAAAHLQGARKAATEIKDMTEMSETPAGSSIAGTLSAEIVDVTENSSIATTAMGDEERKARRQQELELLSLRKKRNRHHDAAFSAFSYADQLEQLSRPVGRSAGVLLGRAAVAADMGKPGAALDDLELALVQLRKNAKVRFLLAKSRIELGQYERGLTDCGVASRLLDFEERLLRAREAEQERKDKEADDQAARSELVRKMDERLAVREHPVAGAEARQLKESGRSESHVGGEAAAWRVQGSHTANAIAEAVTVEVKEASPSATLLDQETTGDILATVGVPDGAGENAAVFTLLGDRASEVDIADTKVAMAKPGAKLQAISEEARDLEAGDVVDIESTDKNGERDDQLQASKTKDKTDRKSDAGDKTHERNRSLSENHDQSTARPLTRGSEDLKEVPSPEEAWDEPSQGNEKVQEGVLSDGASIGAASVTVAGTVGNGKRNRDKNTEASPARLEVLKQRADIELLVAQAEEGMTYVAQSVNMAGLLRGFVFTPHGVPVRNNAIKRELLREGRSTLRQRHRRLLAVEAAKKRERTRDARLMERSFRQAAIMQKAGQAVKTRRAAAMVIYRDVEEAWERQEEERESTKRVEAANRSLELEALAAAEEQADLEATQWDVGIDQTGGMVAPLATNDDMLTVPEAPSQTPSTAARTKPTAAMKKNEKKQQEEENEEEDDPELQKILARRVGARAKKGAGRRRQL